ncbi:hypothetical protein UFOVP265_19 [uncultured Caudovirales phage]|uniref:Uncharacterized protein n=1 Tax=uncultured Caudovirales phage TaxID=2100421 RepID=A0A6J5LK52_9CAUD|nr:hypothetical protein UFOVP265_19 [uncultured Caudovirales phage]
MDMKQEHCKICEKECDPWVTIHNSHIYLGCYHEILTKSKDFYEDIDE